MHGNEPAGVTALERVLQQLESQRPAMRGAFVALTGNVAALAGGVRFVDHDLNRHWLPERVRSLRNGAPPESRSAEDNELLELLDACVEAIRDARGPVYVIDLHTSSGESPPFVTIGDTLRNRAFALRLPVPVILGLEEQLEGTFLEYINRLGHITMGFEGGQHDAPRSIDRIEAVVWLSLAAAGVLMRPDEMPPVIRAREVLLETRAGLPRVLEVRHRHPVTSGDGFTMRRGYSSFQPVAKGTPLARDKHGPIHAPESGRLLLPLYQAQGEDGFFVMREFRTAWLAVSALLRRLRADLIFRLLPGVRQDPDRPETLVIDRHVARFFALEIFHLLGYRKRKLTDDYLVVTRR